jgi:hypothetical protein
VGMLTHASEPLLQGTPVYPAPSSLLCLWLLPLLQGTPVYPAPTGGTSSLHPDLMAVALVVFVAHAAVPRRSRARAIVNGVVAINERGGVSKTRSAQ